MGKRFIITGTDTDVGKTVFSAALMKGLDTAGHNPHYWKPIQSGVSDGVDTRSVQNYTNLPEERFFPEKYIFTEPLSPHLSSEIDNSPINMHEFRDKSCIPKCDGTLLIEGAGGLMVPLTRKNLLINLIKEWDIPVILCARASLGTINHTLLSLEALWARKIPIKGLVFVGEGNIDNIRTISEFSSVEILGHLPKIDHIDDTSLQLAFGNNFNARTFME